MVQPLACPALAHTDSITAELGRRIPGSGAARSAEHRANRFGTMVVVPEVVSTDGMPPPIEEDVGAGANKANIPVIAIFPQLQCAAAAA